ncbi:uncharacterized protein BJ171DRAFT_216834 [Polychytrium aggregatum]|uniref:uncharacterized protein n=1 Tax=Polychytrium aggregatum TaxID=110093 RepID=UPI0022FF3504|nr:uncharacterized protein BJ171DRAFT_216834 [Polychytrium aggregatum]KAI9199375.1 hypothetical protein BJ171DRAFT_216834 [Polychytrium aggregatum]
MEEIRPEANSQDTQERARYQQLYFPNHNYSIINGFGHSYKDGSPSERLAREALDDISWLPLFADNLSRLSLVGCRRIVDFEPLRHLVGLHTLDLDHTGIGDLAPLASLRRLERLYLSGTAVQDVEPLLELAALRRLYLPPHARESPSVQRLKVHNPRVKIYFNR